jgi:hypothetical protein
MTIAATPSAACGKTFESAAGNAAANGISPLVTNASRTTVRYGTQVSAYHIQNREARAVIGG